LEGVVVFKVGFVGLGGTGGSGVGFLIEVDIGDGARLSSRLGRLRCAMVYGDRGLAAPSREQVEAGDIRGWS
jgi:hypothetical protein